MVIAGDLCAAGTVPATILLTSSANPSVLGQPLTLTSSVAPLSATGHVTFYDGITILGTTPLSGGQAALTTSLLLSGPHSFKAYYSGDSVHAPRASGVLAHSITPLPLSVLAPPVSYPAGANASVALGDFNGDGKIDVATVGNTTGAVNVLIGNGDGTFGAPVAYATLPGVPIIAAIATGDFNGDGKTDLAVASLNSSKIAILLGNGDGTFQSAVGFSAANTSLSIVVADFNGDGKADLATANAGSISVLLGNGDGTFQPVLPYSTGVTSQIQWLATADFNGDGKADLLTANSSSASISVLFGNGDGTFQLPKTQPAGPSISGVVVLIGNGDGAIRNALNYAAGSVINGIALADVNRDGRTDIVLADPGSGTVGIQLGTPAIPTTTTLTSTANPASYGQPVTLAITVSQVAATGQVSLFDGSDEITDFYPFAGGFASYSPSLSTGTHFLKATYSGDAVYGSSTSPVLALTVNRAATTTTLTSLTNPAVAGRNVILVAAVSVPAATGTVTFVAGPVTLGTGLLAAGYADLVISTLPVGSNVVTAIYSGDSNYSGSTSPGVTEVISPALTKTATSTNLMASSNSIKYGRNLNLQAIVSPHSATGAVTFYDGVNVIGTAPVIGGVASVSTASLVPGAHPIEAQYGGSSSNAVSTSAPFMVTVTAAPQNGFRPAVSYNAALGSAKVRSADFNGDGVPDLAFGTPGALSIFLGNGDGSFRPAGVYGNNSGGFGGLGIGDFNGDGIPDVAITGATAGTISVFLGAGDGSFSPPINSNAIGNLAELAVADFNKDGKGDIAVANSVLLGNGDGTLQPPVGFSTVGGPACVVVGDFNGDGNPDIASCVGVSLGNGDGTFQSPRGASFGGIGPEALAAGDFNLDGKLDLVASLAGGTLSVILGNGDGTFQPPNFYYAGCEPFYVAAGDFNGDGRQDIVATNAGIGFGYDVSILIGNADGTFQPALSFGTGGHAGDIAVVDLNGDARADLAITKGTGEPFSILLGAALSTPSEAGIFRDNFEWLLDANGNRLFDGVGPGEDYVYNSFIPSQAGDIPVVGDWSGSGTTKIGIFRSGYFWLLDTNGDGVFDTGDQAFAYGGAPGDVPVVGDWCGNGIAKVGVVRPFVTGGTPAFWILDANNDHLIDSGDLIFAFGDIAGDVPVVGDWNGSGFGKAGVYREGFYWSPTTTAAPRSLWVLHRSLPSASAASPATYRQ